jgi:hypothetical protein
MDKSQNNCHVDLVKPQRGRKYQKCGTNLEIVPHTEVHAMNTAKKVIG